MVLVHLGIDIGTQSLKCVLLDHELEVMGRGSKGYATHFGDNGVAEQNPEDWVDAFFIALKLACSQANVEPSAIDSVGVAGQLDGALIVDKTGQMVGPCLIWMDRRATEFVPDVDPSVFRNQTGQVPDASHMGPKIAWLNRNVSAGVGCRFHQPVSWFVEMLCGAFKIDPCLVSTTMMYSLQENDWDRELCKIFGVTEAQLPEIAPAETLAGRTSGAVAAKAGLRKGVAVAVGTGDDFATPFGAGLFSKNNSDDMATPYVAVLGTAEVVGGLCETRVIDETGLLETHPFIGGGYFLENPGWLSGGALTWLVELLGFKGFDELFAIAETASPGADGLTFLPALTGAMAPEWNADARGCFYGLTPAHKRSHLARAVLEACAFAMRDVTERLDSLLPKTPSIRLLGGGAVSDFWGQIRADIAGKDVVVQRGTQAADECPRGAALLGMIACGALGSAREAAEKTRRLDMPSARQKFMPSGHTYDAAYERYSALFESLRPMFLRRG